jgi:hypothetical protein
MCRCAARGLRTVSESLLGDESALRQRPTALSVPIDAAFRSAVSRRSRVVTWFQLASSAHHPSLPIARRLSAGSFGEGRHPHAPELQLARQHR